MVFATYFILIGILAFTLTAMGRKWQLKPKHFLPWVVAMIALGCAAARGDLQCPPRDALVAGRRDLRWRLLREHPLRHPVLLLPRPGTHFARRRPANRFARRRHRHLHQENRKRPLSLRREEQQHDSAQRFRRGRFRAREGVQIGIAMNFLNVHVNRSPISGMVEIGPPHSRASSSRSSTSLRSWKTSAC